MKKIVLKKSTLVILALSVFILTFAFLGNYIISKNNEKTLVGSKWELDYAGIRQGEFDSLSSISNLTLNKDKTFVWKEVYSDGDSSTFNGTYSVSSSKLELKYSSGSIERYLIKLDNNKLNLDDRTYTKVSSNFKKTTIFVESSKTSTNTSSSSNPTTYNCALTGCPNKTTSPGTYCSVHIKGKTNKCITCGASIWSDEIYCDDCLFGDFDFTEYGIDY